MAEEITERVRLVPPDQRRVRYIPPESKKEKAQNQLLGIDRRARCSEWLKPYQFDGTKQPSPEQRKRKKIIDDPLKEILLRVFKYGQFAGMTPAEVISVQQVRKAMEGDLNAARWISDRVDGRPVQVLVDKEDDDKGSKHPVFNIQFVDARSLTVGNPECKQLKGETIEAQQSP